MLKILIVGSLVEVIIRIFADKKTRYGTYRIT